MLGGGAAGKGASTDALAVKPPAVSLRPKRRVAPAPQAIAERRALLVGGAASPLGGSLTPHREWASPPTELRLADLVPFSDNGSGPGNQLLGLLWGRSPALPAGPEDGDAGGLSLVGRFALLNFPNKHVER